MEYLELSKLTRHVQGKNNDKQLTLFGNNGDQKTVDDTFSELGLKEKPKGFDQDYTLKNNPLETKTNFISRETLEEFVGN